MALRFTLVGSEDANLRQLIRSCGGALNLLPVAGLEKLAHPSAEQPDILILDLRAEPVVPPALETLTRQHAMTGVVIVAKSLDATLMLSAIRARANEFVTEPVTVADFEAAIVRVIAARVPPADCKTFAFVGAKGGVGATALAANVATVLARTATSGALMIDLNVPHGDAALYLGSEPRFTILDAVENVHRLDEAFFRTLLVRSSGRLDLLAAPDAAAVGQLPAERVRTILDFASKHFQYTVIDAPRTDPQVLDVLDRAQHIVVVTTQEVPAVRSAAALTKRFERRYGRDRVVVVVSRFDKQAEIDREDIAQAVGVPLAHVFPSDYRLTIAALNRGRPLVLDNHSNLAASVERFTHMLTGAALEASVASENGAKASVWRRIGLR